MKEFKTVLKYVIAMYLCIGIIAISVLIGEGYLKNQYHTQVVEFAFGSYAERIVNERFNKGVFEEIKNEIEGMGFKNVTIGFENNPDESGASLVKIEYEFLSSGTLPKLIKKEFWVDGVAEYDIEEGKVLKKNEYYVYRKKGEFE